MLGVVELVLLLSIRAAFAEPPNSSTVTQGPGQQATVVARLVLVGGYEALPDLAFPSVQSRAILENEDEGVESLILHFNGEAHLPACARSDTLDCR